MNKLVTLVALLSITACGNLTAGGVSGEATVIVSGDASESQASQAPVTSDHQPAQHRPNPARSDDGALDDGGDDADDAEGEIDAELQLSLIAADGSSVPLTDEDLRVRVDVQGREEVVAVRRTIPALRYEALRVVFTELEIEIESGLVISGQTIVGSLEVELEDGTLVVERPVALLVGERQMVEILVDLNAKAWLLEADPTLRTVAEGIVANAISVTLREARHRNSATL